jgi:hypothetical protein
MGNKSIFQFADTKTRNAFLRQFRILILSLKDATSSVDESVKVDTSKTDSDMARESNIYDIVHPRISLVLNVGVFIKGFRLRSMSSFFKQIRLRLLFDLDEKFLLQM